MSKETEWIDRIVDEWVENITDDELADDDRDVIFQVVDDGWGEL